MSNIRDLIREAIKEELEEVSTSDAAGPYNTPNAFRGNSDAGKKKQRQNATQAEYTLVGGQDTADPLMEANRYLEYKNDPSRTSRQKIGQALSEINKSLQEIDRVVKMNARLKTENNIESAQLWKRTNQALLKIENILQQILRSVRELKA